MKRNNYFLITVDRSFKRRKTPYKIAVLGALETPVLFYTHDSRGGVAYPREGARSRQWKRFHPEASHVATTVPSTSRDTPLAIFTPGRVRA